MAERERGLSQSGNLEPLPGMDTLAEEVAERLTGDETDMDELVSLPSGPGGPPAYSRLDRWFTVSTKWLSYLAAIALGLITIVCFVDVVGSKFFDRPIPSSMEFCANLNVMVVFLAVAYVQMDRGSVAIELLQNKFPKILKLSIRIFASILGAASCFFAAYRGWFYLVDFWETHKMASGTWHFAIWPFQAALVLGFVLLGVAFLFAIARDITDFGKKRDRYAPAAKGKSAPPAST